MPGFFATLFARLIGRPVQAPHTFTAEQIAVIERLTKPALRITRTGTGFSRFGGLPQLPAGLEWPHADGKPLAFLCQLSLAEVMPLADAPSLPASGHLFFFFDQDQSVWGFDPKDKPKWRVLFDGAGHPDTPVHNAPAGLATTAVYTAARMGFETIRTYADVFTPEIYAFCQNDESAFEAYLTLSCSEEVEHQVFGHPYAIQDAEMGLECQLVSNGIYLGDAEGHHSPEAQALKSGANDWVLLLQIASDDDLGMVWCDYGALYFWIRKDDLKAGRFEDVWMILQTT